MSSEQQPDGSLKLSSDPFLPKKEQTANQSKMAETSIKTPANASTNYQEWIGKPLGKYQIVSVLGKGAMGVVLRAYDPVIDRDVAIKVLADHLAEDKIALGRFFAEDRSAGKLNHSNVI